MASVRPNIPYCEKCGTYILYDDDMEERNGQIVHLLCGTLARMIPDSPGDQYD